MPHVNTRVFATEVVLSLTHGHLLCDFAAMHELAEYVVGSPVWTHQFAHRPFVCEMAEAVFRQHPHLRAFDATAITTENWREHRDAALAMFGPTLAIAPMGEPEHAAAAFTEPLAGKRVVTVKVE